MKLKQNRKVVPLACFSLKWLLSHQPFIRNLSFTSCNNKRCKFQSGSLTFLGSHSSLVAQLRLELIHGSLYLSNWRGTNAVSVLLTYPSDSLYSFSDKGADVPQGSQ